MPLLHELEVGKLYYYPFTHTTSVKYIFKTTNINIAWDAEMQPGEVFMFIAREVSYNNSLRSPRETLWAKIVYGEMIGFSVFNSDQEFVLLTEESLE